MLTWLIAGIVIGAAMGSLVTWLLLRRRGLEAPRPQSHSEVGHEPPPSAPAASDEVRQVLAANQRALADLEGRYRDRKHATTPEEAPKRGRRRQPPP